MIGEWAVGYWIVGVTSFQKIYGLYGLKHHIVEISGDVTKAGRTDGRTNERTRKDSATQLLNREALSFAMTKMLLHTGKGNCYTSASVHHEKYGWIIAARLSIFI